MDEIIKVKVEEIVIVAPDKVELATPKITTDGKNIVATQSQQGGYVPTEEKTAIVPATSLAPDLKPENIVKGASIFGVEGTKEFKKQTKNIKITQNGTETVTADEGYGMEAVVVETDVQPALQEKEITENGDHTADEGYYGLSVIKVNVQPVLQEKTATENGAVEADSGFYGLKKVNVNVNPPLQKKALTIAQNGQQTVKADDPNYGLSEVEVVVDVQPELQKKSVIINSNGTQTVTPDEAVYGLEDVEITVDVQPKLQNKNVTENGTVAPDEGYDGLSEVVVDINPELQEKAITANGEYTADEGFYGMSKVNVNVKPILQDKTVEITENGTHTITADEGQEGLGTVEVKVSSTDYLAQRLTNEIKEYSNNTISQIRPYGFYYCTTLERVELPNISLLKSNAFQNCTSLKYINLGSNVNDMEEKVFYGCTALENIDFEYTGTSIEADTFYNTTKLNIAVEFKNVTTPSSNAFRQCGFTKIVLPKAASFNSGTFQNSKSLKVVDFGVSATRAASVASSIFSGCTALDTLIIRKTGSVASLSATNAFTNTLIASGTGFIYVPDALVESYKTATNWSTYADQILPLSEYVEK